MALADLKPAEVRERIVIDGVRNLGEVEFLRSEFGYNFILIAIMTRIDARWDRIGTQA